MIKLYVACFLYISSASAAVVWDDESFLKVGKGLYTREETKAYAQGLKVIACAKKNSVLGVNFTNTWNRINTSEWDQEVRRMKADQQKLAPIVTLYRLMEYSKRFKDKKIKAKANHRVVLMKNSKCWPKKINGEEFFYYSVKELVELDTFLEDRYFKNNNNENSRGNKSLQVLLETLSSQMSYEFYTL